MSNTEEDYNELYNLGKEIKNAFIAVQRNRVSKHYRIPKNFSDDKWVDAARLCKGVNLDPTIFVNIFFEYVDNCLRRNTFINPGMLCGGKTICKALKQFFSTSIVKNTDEDTLSEDMEKLNSVGSSFKILTIQKGILETNLSEYIDYQIKFLFKLQQDVKHLSKDENEIPSNILMLRMVAFAIPAWLRIIIAPNDPVVLERFGKEALQQLTGGINGLKECLESRNTLGYDRNKLEGLITKLKIRFGK